MPHEIQILNVRKMPSAEPNRTGRIDTVVFFLRDGTQTEMVVIPKDTVDDKEIQAAIQKELGSRDALVGKKFSI